LPEPALNSAPSAAAGGVFAFSGDGTRAGVHLLWFKEIPAGGSRRSHLHTAGSLRRYGDHFDAVVAILCSGYITHMRRAVLSILLSLVLVVTSHSAAMARGGSDAVDRMVICTGHTAVVVYIGADGQPTTAPHLCPDCALHLLAAVLPPETAPVVVGAFSGPHRWTERTTTTPAARQSASARGPPPLI